MTPEHIKTFLQSEPVLGSILGHNPALLRRLLVRPDGTPSSLLTNILNNRTLFTALLNSISTNSVSDIILETSLERLARSDGASDTPPSLTPSTQFAAWLSSDNAQSLFQKAGFSQILVQNPAFAAALATDCITLSVLLDEACRAEHYGSCPDVLSAVSHVRRAVLRAFDSEGGYVPSALERQAALLSDLVKRGNWREAAQLLDRADATEFAALARSHTGQSPLHDAAMYGNEEMVALLLAKGAPVNAQNQFGVTPLQFAAVNGSESVVRILLDNGASTHVGDHLGRVPLHDATIRGHCSVVKLLLENGAQVDAADRHGRTALHYAVDSNDDQMSQLLLERGADINAGNAYGVTPLHYAAANGSGALVRMLITKGARVNSKTHAQKTPLDMAKRGGHEEVVPILLRAMSEHSKRSAPSREI